MATSIPRPEYPRPQFVRDAWLNLNGPWQFEMDPGGSGEARGLARAERLSGEIVVPFCMESKLSGVEHKDFVQAVWYRRTVTIPDAWKGWRVLLHVGACDFETTVYCNGRRAGDHRGGYSAFTIELTPHLQDGENVLAIHAKDDTRSPSQARGKQSEQFHSHGCDYTRTTGIWQTAWLEAVPQTYLTGARFLPQPEAGGLVVEVKASGSGEGLRLRACALAAGREVGTATLPLSGATAAGFLPVAEPRLWSVEDPFLYDVELILEDAGGQAIDTVKSYFGLRSLSWDGPAVKLNGKPVFQRLILDQGFYPDGIYTAPTDEELKADIERSMAMGFNGARLHQKVFEPRFLYWADRLGYLLWGEMGSWGLDLRDWRGGAMFVTEWTEILERDFNHPALVGWCPFNETGPQNPELLRAVYRTTKLFDPTRPCIDTSGYVHAETDLYDVHDYNQDPESFRKRYDAFANGEAPFRNNPNNDAPYRGQPYWVSEYGGIWWNPGQQDQKSWGYGDRPKTEAEFLARYRDLTEALLNNPRMCAFCYTQLTDVEQEVNGLYTYDRKPKFDPALIKAINAQTAAVER